MQLKQFVAAVSQVSQPEVVASQLSQVVPLKKNAVGHELRHSF